METGCRRHLIMTSSYARLMEYGVLAHRMLLKQFWPKVFLKLGVKRVRHFYQIAERKTEEGYRKGDLQEVKIATCILSLTDRAKASPLHRNMCRLGRYKGVILLPGASLLRSDFISLFSRHRSLYLISYS